jgi:hypothetical protein
MLGQPAGSGSKRPFDVIPVTGKKIKEPSIAAIAKSNMDDLRRRTIQQCPLVEIDILADES